MSDEKQPTLREAAQAALQYLTRATWTGTAPIVDCLRAALAAGDGEQSRLRRLREWCHAQGYKLNTVDLCDEIDRLLAEQPEDTGWKARAQEAETTVLLIRRLIADKEAARE